MLQVIFPSFSLWQFFFFGRREIGSHIRLGFLSTIVINSNLLAFILVLCHKDKRVQTYLVFYVLIFLQEHFESKTALQLSSEQARPLQTAVPGSHCTRAPADRSAGEKLVKLQGTVRYRSH